MILTYAHQKEDVSYSCRLAFNIAHVRLTESFYQTAIDIRFTLHHGNVSDERET